MINDKNDISLYIDCNTGDALRVLRIYQLILNMLWEQKEFLREVNFENIEKQARKP